MDIFNKIRERSPILSRIVKFFNTPLYPALFAAVCIVSGTNGQAVYLPCIAILTAIAVFAGLFSKDLKVFIVPAFLIYYAIGMDVADDYYTHYDVIPTFHKSSLFPLILCLALLAITLIYKLIASKAFKEILQKRGLCFWGIVFIDIALLTNGFFSGKWMPENLLYGALSALVLTLGYGIFLSIFTHSENAASYACHTLLQAGFTVSAQVLITVARLYRENNLILTRDGHKVLNRFMLSLSWGVPTIIGAVIALAIPAAFYLARKHRFSLFYYLSAPFFWLMTVVINTRSAIIFGGIALIAGMIFCCANGKNKKMLRIATIILIILLIATCIGIFLHLPENSEGLLQKVFHFLRFDFDTEEEGWLSSLLGSRADIWQRGIEDFLQAPIFGVGFMSGNDLITDVYYKMYHNIVIEFLGSMGIVGLFAFFIHLKQKLEIIVRCFSLDKLLLLLVPILILCMSLVDNFFFYPNFALLYTAFLAAAEIVLEQKRLQRLANLNKPAKDERPRVVFAFIEAGKGHIVPTRTVCDAFKAKYGDKVEVVESAFFTETGNPDMEKTEKLFTQTVKNQNRTPIVSILCKLGNLIAGDCFALEVLLSRTVSGRKTAPLAIRHIEDMNAHFVYTAHWAIPYYVNKMSKPHPYTVCFCPDVYSNGAFNVDCNEFLISSKVGAKQAERIRMYAGGHITHIPFPSRPEIAALRNKIQKTELRRALGLDEDAFTVSLSDGGYGMARLGNTVRHLLKIADTPLTVIALCGTNNDLYQKLCLLKKQNTNPNVTLVPLTFTDKITQYLAASDLYAGKSGANSISEPASLGIPTIVTKCITYIERGIKNYYVRDLKGAIYLPSAKRAARKITVFAKNPHLLEPYRQNLAKAPQELYNADASADLIWSRLCELGYVNT